MEQSSAARRKSLISLFLANILSKPILNRKKRHLKYNKKEDNFLNWEEDAHRRAAAGRDAWDEDWFPHETL
jgi:hypothetical protein